MIVLLLAVSNIENSLLIFIIVFELILFKKINEKEIEESIIKDIKSIIDLVDELDDNLFKK